MKDTDEKEMPHEETCRTAIKLGGFILLPPKKVDFIFA